MPTHDISGEKLLLALRSAFEPPCNIVPHAGIGEFSQFILRHFGRRSSIERVISSLNGALDCEPPREVRRWLQLTLESLVGQSPTMLCVTREALLRGRRMTLAECFKMVLGIVARAIDDEDFCDDQRAQLVDTDRTRRWSPEMRVEVRPERVRHFLSPLWRKHSHPLASLGNEPSAW
ncbi:enoyl-CoA hydratase/isomerase family protein [Paraburkholderia terrae]|uniref:3-hydroxyisobutyryl-CoA hydrolase n=2 Tax=Paraburkholderia terrae TaxID=311230 RepID=A0A2I8F589_9BURK|nr:hypothetical protein C2L65_44955 [Paraburkholderia terrae]